MKWSLLTTAAIVAGALWWPTQAAEPTPASPVSTPASTSVSTSISATAAAIAAAPALINFDAYRDYRQREFARRQARLAQRLTETGLAPADTARLERLKAYYDWQAAMPADARDRRYRARFDEIDTNHDGTLDAAERAAWRTKERDYYRQRAAARTARAP